MSSHSSLFRRLTKTMPTNGIQTPAVLLARWMFILVGLWRFTEASFHDAKKFHPLSKHEIIEDLVHAVSTIHGWNPDEIELTNMSTLTNSLHEFNSFEGRYVHLILKRQEEPFYQALCAEPSNPLHDRNSATTASHHHRSKNGIMRLETVWFSCDSSSLSEDEDLGSLELLDIKPDLIGNGSHRQLKYLVTIELHFPRRKGTYSMIFLERLSEGVFADTFELQRMVDRGVFQNARVLGDRNLELPTFNSRPSTVVLSFSIDMSLTDGMRLKKILDLDITLPLHARYPRLNQKGHELVEIRFPSFLFRFREEDDRVSELHSKGSLTNNGKSTWRPVVWRNNLQTNSVLLQWVIPAGNPLHASFVAGLTITTALMGVVVLFLVTSYYHKITWN